MHDYLNYMNDRILPKFDTAADNVYMQRIVKFTNLWKNDIISNKLRILSLFI